MSCEKEQPRWVVAFNITDVVLIYSSHGTVKDIAADCANDQIDYCKAKHELRTTFNLIKWSVLRAAERVLLRTIAKIELKLPELVLRDVAVKGHLIFDVVILGLKKNVLLVFLE